MLTSGSNAAQFPWTIMPPGPSDLSPTLLG